MILRKPYAFLIKYFQRINMILLALVLFLSYRTMKFHQFAKNYLDTNIYNEKVDSIANYANIYTYIAFIAVFIICGVLIYLLRKKDKPYISYILILIVNLFAFGLLIYCNNFFTYEVMKGFKIVTAKTFNDLSFIANILYYPLFVILIIRSLGIDLKSFGFQDDKEFIATTEADREEVEVEVGFDKEKWLRNLKYYFRNTKYFILEHKVPLLGVLGIVLLIGIFQFYQYFYVDNRIYGMNKKFSANYYDLKVKNTYLTDKDLSGNQIINSGDTYFIIVNLEVKNNLSYPRVFDMEKVLLYVNNKYYIPSTRYNNYFKDMGNLYEGKEIKAKETTSYLLIYQVPKPDKKTNFVLKYQDVGNKRLVQVKIKVVDISTFKDKDGAVYPNTINIPINENENMIFKINNFTISDSVTYTYQQCSSNGSCPVYEATQTASTNKKILHIKFALGDDNTREEFLDFITNYAKVRYTINGEAKTVKIKGAVNKKYRGNHLYLSVPSEIENAMSVDLIFTIRTYQYTYHLKGE